MCFSAEISFGSAAIVSSIGAVSYRKVKRSPQKVLALIPVFFGIQQFAEGLVWVALSNKGLETLLQMSTYVFIFFAWIIWPIYIPWILWKLEQQKLRKTILLILTILGIGLTVALIYIVLNTNVQTHIQDCSIFYKYGQEFKTVPIFSILYLLVTVFSLFISSVSKIWVLGIVNLLTYFFSKIYYGDHVILVWCFFCSFV